MREIDNCPRSKVNRYKVSKWRVNYIRQVRVFVWLRTDFGEYFKHIYIYNKQFKSTRIYIFSQFPRQNLIKKLKSILFAIFLTEGNDFFLSFFSFTDTQKRLDKTDNAYLVRLLFLSLLLLNYFVQKAVFFFFFCFFFVFFFFCFFCFLFFPEINKQSQC